MILVLTLPNAIVTPHIAGDAAERGLRESIFCIRQAERVAGERVVLSIIPPGDAAAPIGLDPAAGLVTTAEVEAPAPAARL